MSIPDRHADTNKDKDFIRPIGIAFDLRPKSACRNAQDRDHHQPDEHVSRLFCTACRVLLSSKPCLFRHCCEAKACNIKRHGLYPQNSIDQPAPHLDTWENFNNVHHHTGKQDPFRKSASIDLRNLPGVGNAFRTLKSALFPVLMNSGHQYLLLSHAVNSITQVAEIAILIAPYEEISLYFLAP